MTDENALNIYTDGSSLPSPRRGGIAIRFVFPEYMNKDEQNFAPEGFIGATNNEMELKACIEALKQVSKFSELKQVSRIVIHTDSSYVADNYKTAAYFWSKNKWYKRTGAPVQNTEQWKELLKEAKKVRKRIDFQWLRRRSNEHSRAVDKLAKQSAKNATKKLSGFVDVRRKLTNKSVEYGSVKMLGQKISIRIITSKYLGSPHNIWRYKYEVISKKSKFYQNVDIIYYPESLRKRYSYSVRLNKNNDYPQISKVLQVIDMKKV